MFLRKAKSLQGFRARRMGLPSYSGAFFFLAYFLCTAFSFSGYPSIWNAKANTGATYYVSKNGNNANGLSWSTAWNELDQINWSKIQPGSTIILDGGISNMIYTTTLTVEKSGVAGSPITIERSTEPGHNGTVALFGGRSTPLPYCGQPTY